MVRAVELSAIFVAEHPPHQLEEEIGQWHQALGRLGCSFEILLIADGTPGGLGKVLDGCRARWEQVRVIHQHRQGASKALHRGLSSARGQYLFHCKLGEGYPVAPLQAFWSNRGCYPFQFGTLHAQNNTLGGPWGPWLTRILFPLAPSPWGSHYGMFSRADHIRALTQAPKIIQNYPETLSLWWSLHHPTEIKATELESKDCLANAKKINFPLKNRLKYLIELLQMRYSLRLSRDPVELEKLSCN